MQVFGNLTTAFLTYQDSGTAASLATLRGKLSHDLLYLVYLGIATFVLTYVYMAVWIRTGDACTRRIRKMYLSKLLQQEIAFFDDVRVGELTTHLETDIYLIQDGISEKVLISIMLVATFFTGFTVAFIRNWKLALVLFPVVPCIFIIGYVMSYFVSKQQKQEMSLVAKSTGVAHEAITALVSIRAFNMEQAVFKRYDKLLSEGTSYGVKRAFVSGLGMALTFFVMYSAYALAFYYGTKLVAEGSIRSGSVLSVIFALMTGTMSIAMLTPNLQAVQSAMDVAQPIFKLLDREPKIKDGNITEKPPNLLPCSVEFSNVSFSYPARSTKEVLRGCNLSFQAGKTTALVGPSGAGKSTILALIERFYDPTSGSILISGMKNNEMSLELLRSQIGFVEQNPSLFSGTIKHNIALGLLGSKYRDCSEELHQMLIQKAADLAQVTPFLNEFPDGIFTSVGENGASLSGGQKQRIALARAIVKDPPILLLDEPTSALDSQSEADVHDAIRSVSSGRTTICIAHRLNTVQAADEILVVHEGGRLVEKGDHSSLLKNEGEYSRWVSLQASGSQTQSEEPQQTFLGYQFSNPEKYAGANENAKDPVHSATVTNSNHIQQDIEKQSLACEEKPQDSFSSKTKNLFLATIGLLALDRSTIYYLFIPGLVGAIGFGCIYPCFAILMGQTLGYFSQCDQLPNTMCPEPNNHIMRGKGRKEATWFFIVAILAALCMFLEAGCLLACSAKLMGRIRSACFRKLLQMDKSYFDDEENASGKLTSKLATNASKLHGLFGISLGTILQAIATLVSGVAISLAFGWKLALVVMGCLPFTLSGGYVRLRLIIIKDLKLKECHKQAAQQASEALSAIRTVVAQRLEDFFLKQYTEELEAHLLLVQKTACWGSLFYAFSQACSFWVTALAFWYGSHLLREHEYTIQQFYTVFLAVVFGSLQAANAFTYAQDLSSARQSAGDVLNLLNQKPALERDAISGTMTYSLDPSREGHICFDDVHFKYSIGSRTPVLRGITAELEKGKTYAFVGKSGSGKSSLLLLLERMYLPSKGRIFVDGVDLRNYDARMLRSRISIVTQEPHLMQGSVSFNILAGLTPDDRLHLSDEAKNTAIRDAASRANALSFIENLPQGFETDIGSIGHQLSGGQKQRLAIARALIRRPSILLLDEATSAIDADGESDIHRSLREMEGQVTTVIVAHRLSTVQRAHCIFVIDQGRIVEAGTHEELLKLDKQYASLVALQILRH